MFTVPFNFKNHFSISRLMEKLFSGIRIDNKPISYLRVDDKSFSKLRVDVKNFSKLKLVMNPELKTLKLDMLFLNPDF